MEMERKYKEKLRKICEKGKFKALLSAVRTTEELKHGFEPDLSQPLHYFAGRGNLGAVRELIEKYDCNPHCQNLHEVTPLHCACYCGKVGVVKYLVNRRTRCNINSKDKQGVCPLVYTAYCIMNDVKVMNPLNSFHNEPRSEHAHTAKFLLSKEELCATSNEFCVLRLPVCCDCKFEVFMCMEYDLRRKLGAICTELSCEMVKCLEVAIDKSRVDFAENLLRTYPSIIRTAMTSDSVQASALTCFHKACSKSDLGFLKGFLQLDICKPDVESVLIAIRREHYELVQYLLICADHSLLMDKYRTWSSLLSYIFAHYQYDKKLVCTVIATTVDSKLRDAEGNSPIHLACKHSVAYIIEEYDCCQDVLNENLELPLHIACYKDNLPIVRLVSSQLDDEVNAKDKNGNTPLHIVCKSQINHYYKSDILDCFKYLILEKKCDLNITNNQNELPLHVFLKSQGWYYRDSYDQSEREELTRLVSSIESLKINTQDSDGNTPVHLACMNDDPATVIYLVSTFECDMNLINSERYLPLHYALKSKMSLEVISIVSSGCTLKHMQNEEGKTPLHIACELTMHSMDSDEQTKVLDLVSHEKSVNYQDKDGNIPLHSACKQGNLKAVLYLVRQYGCEVNIVNYEQCLPLHYAIESHISIEALKAICNGCTMKYKQNKFDKTPLHIACEQFKYLHFWDTDDKKQLLELISDAKSITSRDKNGNTPLHIACQNNDVVTALYLSSNPHSDVNSLNNQRCLPLHYALNSNKPLEIVKAVSRGCTLVHMQNNDGMTPLHIACKNGSIDVVKYLVSQRQCRPKFYTNSSNIYDSLDIRLSCKDESDIDLLKALANEQNVNNKYYYRCYFDNDHSSPLHVACSHQNILAIKLLVELNGDISYKSFSGRTPLHIACSKSLKSVLSLMPVINNSNVNISDNNNNTPLHLAFKENCLHVVQFLLSKFKCNTNVKNIAEELPVHLACNYSSLEVVKMVTENDFDSNINDETRKKDSPLHIACRAGALSIVKFLVETFDCKPSMLVRNSDDKLPVDYACEHSLAMVEMVSEPCTVMDLKSEARKVYYSVHNDSRYNRHSIDALKSHLTTLDIACFRGSLDIVKYLITQKGCSLSALENSHNALGYACGLLFISGSKDSQRTSWPDVIKYLIAECGYDPGVSIKGQSVCEFACQHNKIELVKALTVRSVDTLDIDSGNTLLHYACLHDCTEIVQFLVELRCDQTIVNQKGELAIHIASRTSLEIMRLLTKCDINSLNFDGETPLHLACKLGKVEIVKYLVEDANCDANIPNAEGKHALHIACEQSLKIECLVQKGDINCQNAFEETPLHIACYNRDYDMIQFLLSNPECRADISDDDDDLALHCLVVPPKLKSEPYQTTDIKNLSETVHSLLDRYSAATEIADEYDDTPIESAIRMGEVELFEILFNVREYSNVKLKQLLTLACDYGRARIVRFLIDHGLSCEIIIKDNENFFQHLCFKSNHSCLETLKELGPLDLNKQDDNDDTILHLACKKESEDVLQYILQYFDDCSSAFLHQNKEMNTPLHLLATKRKLSPRTLTLIKCDNPNTKNLHGNTPLHLACKYGCIDFAERLLTVCRCDPNIPNDKRELPLHIASCRLQPELVKMLATTDNAQKCTDNGDTPLHIACQCIDLNAVDLLMNLNCDLNIPNKQGDTPLHIAVAKSLTLVKKLVASTDMSHISKYVTSKVNENGDTLLHIACRKADYHTVSFLIESLECEVDLPNEQTGATPLHYACERGLLPMVKSVSKCNPSAKINNKILLFEDVKLLPGDTPLHVACRKGDIEVIKCLLLSGHSEALKLCNELTELPIHLAFTSNLNKPMANLFISRRKHYNINARNNRGDTPLHIVCRTKPLAKLINSFVHKLKCKIDLPNKEGNLPLHIACKSKRISKGIIISLSQKLRDDSLVLPNNDGYTALQLLLQSPHDHYEIENFKHILQMFIDRCSLTDGSKFPELIQLACRYQRVDVVEYFCENYSTPSLKVPISVLYEACLNNNQGVLDYTLGKFEHDINIPNATEDLPLHLAARAKGCMMSTILILIQRTVNVNHTNNQGNTLLHEFYNGGKLFCKSEAMITCLKAKCTNLSIQNHKNQTPLHCMLMAGRYDELKLVLAQMKIDSNIQDDEGFTLMHLACQANNFDAVQLLLTTADANPSLEDKKGQTPITLATDPNIIKLLTEHGADPQPLYAIHRIFFESREPPPTPVNLMVIGHPSVGKTTLIQSLQNEIFEKVISERFEHTAGVVPTNFNSLFYGEVTFYDFAGQPEYYASHDTVVHITIKNIPPIVLVIINLTESDKIVYDQLHYWINFIANRCAGLNDKAHMVVIGSHADILERDGMNPSLKVSRLHQSIISQLESKKIILKDVLRLNCTKSHSDEMKRLRNILQKSTDDLRDTGVMHFNSHCFYVFLLQMFKNSNVVTLSRVVGTLKFKAQDSKANPLFLLPSNRSAVIKLCQDLDEKGHLMFIEHPTIMDMSWLILNKLPLMNKIIGSLFAPADFPQHRPLSYSTGVVPMSRFDKQLCTKHNYPVSLSLTFLSRMEYCREITDKVVLESIVKKEEFSKTEKYFFFPTLVSLERPTDKWSTDTNFSYKCGWLIQCTIEGELFSPLFIQALLLRLAFSFTPKKIGYDTKDLETYKCSSESDKDSDVVINRLCSVWNSGIYWQEESGVKTIVDVLHQRTLVLLMQCLDGCEIELVRRRSQIISMILNAKEEFCSEAKIIEYFMHPRCVTHPLLNLENIRSQLFSFPRVKSTIGKKQPCVVNEHDKSVKLDTLLYFEPYSELSMYANKSKVVHIYEDRMEQLSIFRGRQLPQGMAM